MKNHLYLKVCIATLLPIMLTSCEGGSVSDSDIPGKTAHGFVGKGPIKNSSCTLKGDNGQTLSTGTSNSTGKITFPNVKYTGVYYSMHCSGGEYTNEATGTTVLLTASLRGAKKSSDANNLLIIATPLTNISFQSDAGTTVAELKAIIEREKEYAGKFGLEGVDIGNTIPTDVTQHNASTYTAANRYGVVLAGIAKLIDIKGISLGETLFFLANDTNNTTELREAISQLSETGTFPTTITNVSGIISQIIATIGYDAEFTGWSNKIVADLSEDSDASSYKVCWSTSNDISEDNCPNSKIISTAGLHSITDPSSIANGTNYYVIAITLDKFGNMLDKTLAITEVAVAAIETIVLNDTGVTISGNYPSGNNASCPTGTDNQDCSEGRDVDFNDDTNGHAGFEFTKLLAADGSDLAASETVWGCIKDEITGLTWENKQDNRGGAGSASGYSLQLHAGYDKFTWFQTSNNAGNSGSETPGDYCFGYVSGDSSTYCNTSAYIDRVNTEAWCGASNWRLPTTLELMSIVNYSETTSLDSDYFDNISASSGIGSSNNAHFWTSDTLASDPKRSWSLGFYLGRLIQSEKNSTANILLVHD